MDKETFIKKGLEIVKDHYETAAAEISQRATDIYSQCFEGTSKKHFYESLNIILYTLFVSLVTSELSKFYNFSRSKNKVNYNEVLDEDILINIINLGKYKITNTLAVLFPAMDIHIEKNKITMLKAIKSMEI